MTDMNATGGFIAHDASFARVTGPEPAVELVVSVDAHEGPVYLAGEDALYVTSLPAPGPTAVIKRIAMNRDRFPVGTDAVSVVVAETAMPNGMTGDEGGRLIICEQGDLSHEARISRLDPATGDFDVLVDGWRGRRLNSPNDVAVAPDGSVWFTDPSYGHLQGFRSSPESGDFVYRWDLATATVDVVADGFDKPNGIVLSPDGATIYVTDSGANQTAGSFHVDRPHHVVAFDVTRGGRLTGRRVIAVTSPGIPDGLKVDADGRLYVSSDDRVLVLSPEGNLLGEILAPGAVNFTFGGPEGNILFVTADTAVWAASLAVTGPTTPLSTCPIAEPIGA